MYLKDYTIQAAKNLFIRFPKKVMRFGEFWKDYHRFKKLSGDIFSIDVKDIYPCLADKIQSTPFDQHYIYHPAWAARILANTKPEYHVDFSSILYFGTILSAFIPVKFFDYRPANLVLDGWDGGFADLGDLKISDNSYPSVSCMHTVEHIGLGRYGDAINPLGDAKAVRELIRVTKYGGDILFATPVGKQRIEFNAHRIYSYELILQMFEGCKLKEFSLIPDKGELIRNAAPSLVAQQNYGCGCFWFKKI